MKAKYILGFFLLYLPALCRAQTVYFTYDNAGNRETRSINLPLKSTLSDSSFYNENEELKFEDEQEGGKKILIYPNPTQGQLRIEFQGYSENERATINLYTITGTLLLSQKNISQNDILDLSEFKSATYIMRIIVGDKTSEWKIIKE